MKNYFAGVYTVDEIKALYRKLIFKYHPDVSGFDSTRIMQDINAQYQEALRGCHGQSSRGSDNQSHTYYYNEERETAAASVIQQLIRMRMPSRIVVELVGTWVWVSGTLKSDEGIRAQFREIGLRWHSKRSKWYWKPEGSYAKFNSRASFDDLRSFYGSKVYEHEEA